MAWDLTNLGSSPQVLSGHTDAINSVTITPDGKWALTGSHDKTEQLWELISRMSLIEVQKIIGAHEEKTDIIMHIECNRMQLNLHVG